MSQGRLLTAIVLLVLASAPVVATAQDELRGMFRLTRTTADILDAATAQELGKVIPVDEELQWQLYVPDNYDRQRPAGVLVFVDPGGWGGMPDAFRPVFDSHNMIWIGANRTGRNSSDTKLIWTAILASRVIQQDYVIDLNRMYIGSAGSGAGAALNAMLTASEFTGALYIGGSAYWDKIQPDYLDNLRRKYYVFLTGTKDKEKAKIRSEYESYKKDGIENVKLIFDMQGPGATARPEHLDEAFRYLDSRLN